MSYGLLNMSDAEFKDLIAKGSSAELYSENGVVRAIMQMIPYVGPLLDTVLASPGTKQKEERLLLLFSLFYQSLVSLQEQIGLQQFDEKLKLVNNDDFYDMLLSAIESSARTRSREKIIMNSMILSNLMAVKNEGVFWPEEYLNAIEQLTSMEVQVLLIFYKAYNNKQSKEEENELEKAKKVDIRGKIQEQLYIDQEDLDFILKRLERSGFIKEISGTYYDYLGGIYTVTDSLLRMMKYLAQNPLNSLLSKDTD